MCVCIYIYIYISLNDVSSTETYLRLQFSAINLTRDQATLQTADSITKLMP